MFGRATDEWETPQAFFDALDAEFGFDLDTAAKPSNAKTNRYLSDLDGALSVDWFDYIIGEAQPTCWLNPPYSKVQQFIAKAAWEARKGCTVVCLVPSRTDTRWWHEHIWDSEKHQPRPGVEIRFVKGRLKFGEGKNSAPFPSVVVIFRPVTQCS